MRNVLAAVVAAAFLAEIAGAAPGGRGDPNGDGLINAADVEFLTSFLFGAGPGPSRICSLDTNADDAVTALDDFFLINHVFSAGPPPIERHEDCNGLDDDCDGETDNGCVVGESCALPEVIATGAQYSGSIIGALDDHDVSCAQDGVDRVHQFSIDTPSSVLIDVTSPAWSQAVSLRPASQCADAAAQVACFSELNGQPYFTRPNLVAGSYAIVVDGSGGGAGEYTIRVEAREPDTTFGYWRIDTTGIYAPIQTENSAGVSILTFTGNSDDGYRQIALPFNFPYYGTTVSTITVSTNGYIVMAAAAATSFANQCPQSTTLPNNIVAVFWDDLIIPGGSDIRTVTLGTAPARRFVIEYRDVGASGPDDEMRVNQQIVLHERGDIEFRYGPRSTTAGDAFRHQGSSATIGIENATGTDIDAVRCNTATPPLVDGTVIYWVYPR